MVENIGRKLTTILILLGVSLALLLFKDPPLTMGLDLRGGTRMTLQIDFDQAQRDGIITQNDDRLQLLGQMIGIFRDRIDPNGVLEPIIHSEGTDRIIIELPGVASTGGRAAEAPLASPLSLDGEFIVLGANAEGFPAEGGVVRVGLEDIRYVTRTDDGRLAGLTRGVQNTNIANHAEAESVVLISNNAIRNAIENLGSLSFVITAIATDLEDQGTDLATERSKVTKWLAANPERTLADYNSVPEAEGGPSPAIDWYAQKDNPLAPIPIAERLTPTLVQSEIGNEDFTFTGQDLARAYPSQDPLGRVAVGFEFKTGRKGDFADFTEDYTNRGLTIILNGNVESTATINGSLPGAGIIQGEFTPEYVDTLVKVLRTGSLKIKPKVASEERVGATLGDQYVYIGFLSSGIAILVVMIFMIVYYRRLGVYTAIGLTSTLIMLLGALSFMNATLTLPGVAGIILTVGMAVDANILIFDRIREEMDNGRNIKQAAKNGFSRAAVTIFDANLTTLITAIILYVVGTGPVKGFAVTLIAGVLTSMFSALVIVKLLVHRALENGVKSIPMGTWLVTANYKFMSKAKPAIIGSILAIIAGVSLFAWLPDNTKLSIDFLGGATMQIRTAKPEKVERVRELIATIPGDLSNSEVKPVLAESDGDGTYSSFRIAFKTQSSDVESEAAVSFKDQVSQFLGEILLTEPILVSIDSAGTANVALRFGEEHDLAEVQAAVAKSSLTSPVVTADVGTGSFELTGNVKTGVTEPEVAASLRRAFDEAGGFTLAESIPDFSEVGSQVVGELRDKAILAILVSLFAIVMYIRVRFAEYSYGIAAVVAVIHDVLITLGVLSIFMWTGWVQVEISVAMIAAFLTIIGYSLNDTIVLFDRVRENLPRMETDLSHILDASINVTLSRTILTSLTTFIAVVVLLGFNLGTGNVLEGFALTMTIGVIVGTYSSVYIASPVLLFLEKRSAEKRETAAVPATN